MVPSSDLDSCLYWFIQKSHQSFIVLNLCFCFVEFFKSHTPISYPPRQYQVRVCTITSNSSISFYNLFRPLHGLEHLSLFICHFAPWISHQIPSKENSSMETSQDYSTVHNRTKKKNPKEIVKSLMVSFLWVSFYTLIITGCFRLWQISCSWCVWRNDSLLTWFPILAVLPVLSGLSYYIWSARVYIWTWCWLTEGCLFPSRNVPWAMLMSLCSFQAFLKWCILVLCFPCSCC